MRSSSRSGLTIIEILVVTFISSIMIVALVRFMGTGFPLARVTYVQARSTETVRVQLKRIAKALRELRPSDTGGYALIEASPTRLIFYANVDGDAAVERVRYELTGTDLVRGITKPQGTPLVYPPGQETTTVVARYIRNGATPVFRYFSGQYPTDSAQLSDSDRTDIKYIEFYIVLDVDPSADPPATIVQSQVQLRNLKTNLAD